MSLATPMMDRRDNLLYFAAILSLFIFVGYSGYWTHIVAFVVGFAVALCCRSWIPTVPEFDCVDNPYQKSALYSEITYPFEEFDIDNVHSGERYHPLLYIYTSRLVHGLGLIRKLANICDPSIYYEPTKKTHTYRPEPTRLGHPKQTRYSRTHCFPAEG
jgi:hypothetical protein